MNVKHQDAPQQNNKEQEMFELGMQFGAQRLGELLVAVGLFKNDREALRYRIKALEKHVIEDNNDKQ